MTPNLETELNAQGSAILPSLLTAEQCGNLIALYAEDDKAFRASLTPAAGGLGSGGRKHIDPPLPEPIDTLRQEFYRCLAPIANRWSEAMRLGVRYPAQMEEWPAQGRQTKQTCSLSTLLCDDVEALRSDADDKLLFPLQVVILLSEPKRDFTGGEFVMSEQRPRMQSRPMVLSLRQGDAAVIATGRRPFQGAHGVYQVNSKHGVSRVRWGRRYELDVFFHGASQVADL